VDLADRCHRRISPVETGDGRALALLGRMGRSERGRGVL
jgi:hypothetical protein